MEKCVQSHAAHCIVCTTEDTRHFGASLSEFMELLQAHDLHVYHHMSSGLPHNVLHSANTIKMVLPECRTIYTGI